MVAMKLDQHYRRKRNWLLVPVDLLAYGISNKCLSELRTFILLKHISNGHLDNFRVIKPGLANTLGCCDRTIQNHIKSMTSYGWIGVSKRYDRIHLRSFDYIHHKLGFKSHSGCYFEREYLNVFSTWSFAAVIVKHINWQKLKRWLSERKKGRSLQDNHLSALPKYNGISVDLASQILGISKTHVHNYK